jgi:hypothetical protein
MEPPDAAVTPHQPDGEHQLVSKHSLLRSPGNSPKKKKARQHKVGRGSSPSKAGSKKLKGAVNAWTIFTTVERKRRPRELLTQMTLSDIWSRMSEKERAPYHAAADSTKEHYKGQLDALRHTVWEDEQPSNDFWEQHDQWWKVFWDGVHAIPRRNATLGVGSEAGPSNAPQGKGAVEGGRADNYVQFLDTHAAKFPPPTATTHALLRMLPQLSNPNPLRRMPTVADFRPVTMRTPLSTPAPTGAPADERGRNTPERLQERNAGLNVALAPVPPSLRLAHIPPPLRLTDGRATAADQAPENRGLYASSSTPPRRD